ncbi:MAG: hypothetical protein J0665_16250 [Deltaproteobacteria bacterium]|nr:hypothetical protein [Deltaproteobacteria bacterium]
MAISDFFRTVSDPYYLKNVVDEFFQIMSEIKAESKILAEEIDEITHKDNAFSFDHHATDEEMKTTVDLRKDAEEAFEAKHDELLNARGLKDEWRHTAYDAMACLERLSNYLQKEEENDLHLECMVALQNNFRRIPLRTSTRLKEQAERLRRLLEEPAHPEYQPPSPDQESILGLSEREERIAATEIYLSDINDLRRKMNDEINRLKANGPCFSPTVLEEQEQELFRTVLKLAREKTSFGGFAAWASLPHLSRFNTSRDLLSQARVLQEKEQKTLTDLSLLSAVLYLLISAVLDNKTLEAQVIIDMQQAVCKNEE